MSKRSERRKRASRLVQPQEQPMPFDLDVPTKQAYEMPALIKDLIAEEDAKVLAYINQPIPKPRASDELNAVMLELEKKLNAPPKEANVPSVFGTTPIRLEDDTVTTDNSTSHNATRGTFAATLLLAGVAIGIFFVGHVAGLNLGRKDRQAVDEQIIDNLRDDVGTQTAKVIKLEQKLGDAHNQLDRADELAAKTTKESLEWQQAYQIEHDYAIKYREWAEIRIGELEGR